MPDRPNVLWVFADQMRGHAMSCAADPNVETPNLDRLAAEGVRFSNACSTYPLCVPFRFTLLTGEYAHTRWIPALNWRMSPVERTIAHRFNDAGYETCYVGKWHLNGSMPWTKPGESNRGRAFNRTPILPGYRGGFEVWHAFNLRNGFYDTSCFHGDDPTPVPLDGYQTDRLFDITIDYLEKDRAADRPFFAVLSVEAPHPPHEAPEEFMERVRARDLQKRPNVQFEHEESRLPVPDHTIIESEERYQRIATGYYAQVENLDHNIGRLMASLERAGLADNTVVLFFSDHGELLASHGLYQKQFPQEESINIPFIARVPGLPAEQRGRVLDAPICTEDIYPTTLALAGLDIEDDKPGVDLAAYMAGETADLPREGVYLEFVEEHRQKVVFFARAWRGLRTRRWKYVVLDTEPWHLFDLAADPYEQNNLVDSPDHADVRARLHAMLAERIAATDDSFILPPL